MTSPALRAPPLADVLPNVARIPPPPSPAVAGRVGLDQQILSRSSISWSSFFFVKMSPMPCVMRAEDRDARRSGA